jgi:hypothetical protein
LQSNALSSKTIIILKNRFSFYVEASYTGGSQLLYLNITSSRWNYTHYANVSSNPVSSIINALGYALSFG